MRKRMAVCAALSLCILLAGCGAKRQEEVQQHYRAIASAQMQAELVSHLTDEGRAYKAAGRSYRCALWVHGTDFSPCYAELSRQGQVAVTARITDFTCQLEQTPEVG